MIGEVPLHIVLIALSLEGRLKKDKPQLIVVNDTIEICPPAPLIQRKFPQKKKSMFFIGDDK